jgi:protein SCO1/2
VLKKFAEIRELDLNNWTLLTGDINTIADLLRRFEVRAIPTDSTYSEDGELSYSIMHTDRISLIDKNGILKKHYPGSKLNVDEIFNDIKILEE